MARALQQSVRVGPLSGALLQGLPTEFPSSFQACSSFSRTFLRSSHFERQFTQELPSFPDIRNVDTSGGQAQAVSAYREDSDYSSEDEYESPSPSEPRARTEDWRDMLQAKDKKELRAYAHAQKDSIGTHHVGKFGITPNVEISLSDALEKNELIKVKVLSNSPEEMSETVKQLETALRCVCAGQVGRVLLLYRPSKKKLEKKKAQEAAAASAAKRSTFGAGRGRGRGSSRGGRTGSRDRSGYGRESEEFSFSQQRGRSKFEDADDDGGYY